jgi:hypothetical protein
MANIELDWEVEGMIQADESVRDMLKVIGEKNENDSGTFWCWNGKVSISLRLFISVILDLMIFRPTRGNLFEKNTDVALKLCFLQTRLFSRAILILCQAIGVATPPHHRPTSRTQNDPNLSLSTQVSIYDTIVNKSLTISPTTNTAGYNTRSIRHPFATIDSNSVIPGSSCSSRPTTQYSH